MPQVGRHHEYHVVLVKRKFFHKLFPIEIENQFVRFEVQPVAVDRGEVAEMFVEVKQLDGFRGKATVQLVGLPHEVSSEAQVLDAETETLVFPLLTGDASPVGKHTTLQFQAHFALEGGEVLQALAAAELRIQKPAPAPAPAKPVVVEAAAKVKPKKTLSMSLSWSRVEV